MNTGMHFRDNAGGREYNSFYGDFGGATMLIESGQFPRHRNCGQHQRRAPQWLPIRPRQGIAA